MFYCEENMDGFVPQFFWNLGLRHKTSLNIII